MKPNVYIIVVNRGNLTIGNSVSIERTRGIKVEDGYIIGADCVLKGNIPLRSIYSRPKLDHLAY